MRDWLARHKWLLIVAVGLTALLLLAACGDDDDDDGGATATPGAATEALVAMCFPESCTVALREAIEQGIISNFIFVDGTKSQQLFDDIGVENFEGMWGTAPGSADPAIAQAFADRFNASEFGPLSTNPFQDTTYDAVYLIALAAARANSLDGAALRDNLVCVANPEGTVINPGPEGYAAALAALANGEEINYEGVAGPQDFDENGDVAKGAIETWQIVNGVITSQSSSIQELGTAAGCTAEAGDTPPTDPLKIGLLFSFTGDLSRFAGPMFDTAQLAAQEINANGGVFGLDIELVDADTGTDSTIGVASAQTLVDVEGVHAIVGALSSGVSQPIAETVTGPAGVLQISPASTSNALSVLDDNGFFFRTTIADAGQAPVLADLVYTQLGLRSVCNFYVNTVYGEGLSDGFTVAFEALGGTITNAVPHEQEQPTYVSLLQECVG